MSLAGLPHAYPFLLLDRIITLDPGRYVVATKNLTATDPLLQPTGVLSPVFLVEALTQAAGIAVGAPDGGKPAQPGMLARVDRFRTRGRVTVGDELRIAVRIVRTFGTSAMARGVVTVDGRRRAAAELVLHLGALAPSGPTPA